MSTRRVPKCRRATDTTSDGLILAHLPLVRIIAGKIRAGLPSHVELSDLIQDGVCGLIGAARRYDARRGIPFALYAKHRIRGAILDGLRGADPATRDFRCKVKRYEAAAHELGCELGRQPSAAEVTASTGILQPVACDESSGTDGDKEVADESWGPDMHAGHAEMKAILHGAMGSLPRRYRQIVLMYHWRGLTMREIGTAFGINESRVSQIHKRALELIAGWLTSNGINSLNSILG